MTKIDDGGPAFPFGPFGDPERDAGQAGPGMTLRDWFAGQALEGVLAFTGVPIGEKVTAADAYAIADAMLAERQKGKQP